MCRLRERCLHLMASSGRYTHVHGPHSRMPFGLYKLGRIATGKVNKFLTNDILNDPQIMDHEWARELGLASFAGYKLQDSAGEPIGVLALFSKQPITPEENSLIESLSDTTAQVIQSGKQEEVLKLERDRIMSILGSMGDGVFIINQDYDIEYTNPVIEKDFGLANGSKCYRYFHDRDETCPWCNNSKVFAGKTVQCEWHSHKSNKTYELLGTPLRTLDGRISKLEIARDITDRKRTEESLRKHEQHLESINQIGLLASKSLDLDEVLQCVLDGVLKASGAPTGMIFIKDPNDGSLNLGVSKGLSDSLVKEFSKYPYQDGECLVGRIFVTSESIYIRENTSCDPRINRSVVKEGKLNSFIGVPVFSEDEVVAVIIILTHLPDVLEKLGIVLVEAVASHVGSAIRNARFYTELKKAEEKYRSLYENSLDGIYRSDQNGNFIDANPALIKMLGFRDKAELLSVKAKDLYFSELAWKEALEKRKIFSGCVRRKDGSEIWLESSTQTIRDEQENIIYYEGIVRNISERKRTEEALRNAQKLESLGVLAGGIAHDFNNLLVSILGNADIAMDELSPSSPARQYIQDVMSGAKQAAELAMQMLAYSGRGEFLLQPLDLSKLVEEITHLLEVSISKTCVLKYHFNPQIPAIKADASQIRQVVMNFVINASEAIGEKSGVISITTGAMDVDSNYLKETYLDDDLAYGCYVYIEVSDTGCGMNGETKAKIFDPFFTTKFTGRGLGLAAALGIIRSHNGALKVYSELGQGTTFKVLFPACDAPVAPQLPSKNADR